MREVDEHLLYRRKFKRPQSLEDLIGESITVPGGSASVAVLGLIQGIRVEQDDDRDTPALLAALWRKPLQVTVATSDYVSSFQPLYPEVTSAFTVRKSLPIGWAFSAADDSLKTASIHFLNAIKRSGKYQRLMHTHQPAPESFDYVETRRLIRAIRDRLLGFRAAFKAAAKANQLDWRLLASIGYQESHWDPAAVSPTGDKGIMMLMKRTAEELGATARIPQPASRVPHAMWPRCTSDYQWQSPELNATGLRWPRTNWALRISRGREPLPG